MATRTLLSIAMPGAEALAAERRDAEHGAAKEAAALGALQLLRLGFERDEDVVHALHHAEAGERNTWNYSGAMTLGCCANFQAYCKEGNNDPSPLYHSSNCLHQLCCNYI